MVTASFHSEILCDQFAKVTSGAGNQVEKIVVGDKKISFCIACNSCQRNAEVNSIIYHISLKIRNLIFRRILWYLYVVSCVFHELSIENMNTNKHSLKIK